MAQLSEDLLIGETQRSSYYKDQDEESTTISAFIYFKQNGYLLARNPIDRSDIIGNIDEETENKSEKLKTIEDILASSKESPRSAFKRRVRPKSPIYIRKTKVETKPNSSKRYKNLFRDAERRRSVFEKKRKSLSYKSSALLHNTTEKPETDRKVTNNPKQIMTLPFKADKIFDSQKGKVEPIKSVEENGNNMSKVVCAEIKKETKQDDISKNDNEDKGETAKEVTSKKSLAKQSSIDSKKDVLPNNSLFLRTPPQHYITRQRLRYPIFPNNGPSLIPYNPIYPNPGIVRMSGFLGPLNPVQLPRRIDPMPLVPIIDGYPNVHWIK